MVHGPIVSSLEWMSIIKGDGGVNLAGDFDQVRLKTDLAEVSYDVMKIQVEADVLFKSLGTVTLTAQFATKSVGKRQNRRPVIVDDDDHDASIEKLRKASMAEKKLAMASLLSSVAATSKGLLNL